LRLCLARDPCDLSLREAAAWAQAIGLTELSDVAALRRLRGWRGHRHRRALPAPPRPEHG